MSRSEPPANTPVAGGFLERLARLSEAANADPVARRLGRHCVARIYLAADEEGGYLDIVNARISAPAPGPAHLRSVRFALRAPWSSWQAFWSRFPPPGFHDIFALARYGHMRIDGDLDPLLTYLPYFKRILELPRRV